ncbi:hypothetical protein [Nibribacter koreensis]|uniref:Uncharacterized protein n=1 Tax=Nibribacter koreensis TaxID=1084519 RepID=A0ABP8FBG0_9BACT
MKKQLLLSLLLAVLVSFSGFGQDIILKTNGDEFKAKVIEITLSQVLYTLPETKQDSIHALDRKEVFMVTFANGTKEVLNQESPEQAHVPLTPTQMALLGRKDAKLFYKGTSSMWGSTVATLLFFPAVVVIGAVPPKINAREVSDIKHLSNPHYAKAYKKQAHNRKLGKVAIGAGIGIVTVSAMSVMLAMVAPGK